MIFFCFFKFLFCIFLLFFVLVPKRVQIWAKHLFASNDYIIDPDYSKWVPEYLLHSDTVTVSLLHCYMHACIAGQIKSPLFFLSNITNYFFLDNITASDEGEEWLLSPNKAG